MSDKPWRDIHSGPFDIHEYLKTVGEFKRTPDLTPPNAVKSEAEITSRIERQHVGDEYGLVMPLDEDVARTQMLNDARQAVELAINGIPPVSRDLL